MRLGAVPHKEQQGVREALRQSEGWEPKCLALPALEGFGPKGKTSLCSIDFWQWLAGGPVCLRHGAPYADLLSPSCCRRSPLYSSSGQCAVARRLGCPLGGPPANTVIAVMSVTV